MALHMSTHTEYDLEHLEELQRVISKTIDPSVARREQLIGLAWSVCAFIACYVSLRHGFHPIIFALFFVIGGFSSARVLQVYRSMARKSYLNMDKAVTRNTYTLDKSHIVLTNAREQHQYPYSQCFRLLETKKNLYFIMKDGQGLILDKTNLQGGTPEQLRAWLEDKSGKKAEQLGNLQGAFSWLPDLHFTFPGSGPRRLR